MGKDHQVCMFTVPVAPPPEAPMGPMVRKVFTSEWILGVGTQGKPQCRTCCGREVRKKSLEKREREREKKKKKYIYIYI